MCIRDRVNNVMDVGSKQNEIQNLNTSDSVNSGTQLYVSPNAVQNQRSLGFMNQRLEVELSEIYVKSNTLKKTLENALGTEVMISIDVSERFNPLIADPENYIADIVSMLKEVDYLTSAVSNISKNANYLGIEVTEQMLREKLNLMTSNRFSIVFTKKPVEKHKNIPRLKFNQSVKKKGNKAKTGSYKQVRNNSPSRRSLVPLAIGLLIVGFFIVAYSVNQTFFSTSVINDEQELLANKFAISSENLAELRSKNLSNEMYHLVIYNKLMNFKSL